MNYSETLTLTHGIYYLLFIYYSLQLTWQQHKQNLFRLQRTEPTDISGLFALVELSIWIVNK